MPKSDDSPETSLPRREPPIGFGQWNSEEVRRVGGEVIEILADYLAALPERPVQPPLPADVATRRSIPAPGTASTADAVLAEFREHIAPYPFGNGHPGFFGWVNSPPDVMGIFAELLASMMNPSCAGGQHAAIELERQLVGWMREMFSFPEESMGLFVSGGSAATLTALVVARHVKTPFDVRQEGLQSNPRPLVAYLGLDAHTCATKAFELLGIGRKNLRVIANDADGRLDPRELRARIRADLDRGDTQPFAIVASAGTATHGSIDPIDAIADIAAEFDLWLHVDGSYGAPAILAPAYRERLEPLKRADSLALDPHKWFCAPVEAGFVLCRHGAAMRDSFRLVPAYIREDDDRADAPFWFSEWGLQQTRGFRALKVWMLWKHHGTAGLAEAISGDIVLAEYLADLLRGDPEFELWEPQSLSIVCFRHVAPDGTPEEVDDHNRRILGQVQARGQVFPTSTSIRGRFWLRACIVNPWTTRREVDLLVQTVRETGARLSDKAS